MTALTTKELRELLKRLDGESADDLESDDLEFKSGNATGRRFASNPVRFESR